MKFMSVFYRLIALLGFTLLLHSVHAEVRAGEDYDLLPEVQPVETPGKIEVIEFFWYKCPHCQEIQPHVNKWHSKLPADVVFRPIHVNWAGRNDLVGHAKLYLTLKAMNLMDAQHDAVFDAIFKDNIELRDEAKLFEWVGKRGIDRAKFEGFYKSFGVQSQLGNLQKMSADYRVDGTPTFIVNGKYKTSPGKAKGLDRVFWVIDQLIAAERASKKPAAKPASK